MSSVDAVTPSHTEKPTTAASPPLVAAQVSLEKILHVAAWPREDGAADVRSALEQAHNRGDEARWIRLTTSGSFEALCERLTVQLQGVAIGGEGLGPEEQVTYASVSRAAAGMVAELAPSCDLAFLHDPATAGLCAPLKGAGAGVVWVCHAEIGKSGEGFREAWEFLAPYIEPADALVLVRASRIPAHRETQRVVVASPDTHRPARESAEVDASGLASVLASIAEARR